MGIIETSRRVNYHSLELFRSRLCDFSHSVPMSRNPPPPFFFCFVGLHPGLMDVPRLGVVGVELELQLPATATATPDPSCVFDLHHSLWQCQILNALSEARDQTCILMETSRIPFFLFFFFFFFFFFLWPLPRHLGVPRLGGLLGL